MHARMGIPEQRDTSELARHRRHGRSQPGAAFIARPRALFMPTFMRRMSDRKPISPWALLRVKVMAMMSRSWP